MRKARVALESLFSFSRAEKTSKRKCEVSMVPAPFVEMMV